MQGVVYVLAAGRGSEVRPAIQAPDQRGKVRMEDYPRQKDALVTVVAVEESRVVVADADNVRYRARVTASPGALAAEPLKPGDVLIVNHVNPGDGLTVVERLTTMGQRDGSQYELFDYQLASKSEPA
jgi:hypothetical protein